MPFFKSTDGFLAAYPTGTAWEEEWILYTLQANRTTDEEFIGHRALVYVRPDATAFDVYQVDVNPDLTFSNYVEDLSIAMVNWVATLKIIPPNCYVTGIDATAGAAMQAAWEASA